MRYYFDSNVFVYSVTQEDRADQAREAIERLESGEIKAATSVLTLDEVTWIVQQEADRETAVETGKRLLEIPNLEILENDAGSGAKLLQVMSESNLDPRDSLHVATALEHGIYTAVTEDSDLEEAEEIEAIDTRALLERIE